MSRYRKLQFLYIAVDMVSAVAIWLAFLLFRWLVYDGKLFNADEVLIPAFNLWRFSLLYILGCLVVYYLSGYYLNVLRRKFTTELTTTFISAMIISFSAFFLMVINDYVVSYQRYYVSLITLFLLQFVLSLLPRMVVSAVVRFRYGTARNTAVIGDAAQAEKLLQGDNERKLVGVLQLSEIDKFARLKEEKKVQEVVLALHDDAGKQQLYDAIYKLYPQQVEISFPASVYDMLTGAARIGSLSATPLVTVTRPSMPDWQLCVKRAFDVVVSVLSLVLFSPLMLGIAIAVKTTSKGKIIYRQERVGMFGRPFDILKFRTMVADAEDGVPQLSSANDPRITRIGHWLRKYRLDELPQFWNILRGDMSVVGPRPERQFYIDQIAEQAPYYCLLYKIRPGLTSWGPVRVGYTDTLEKMLRRLNYDIVYVENMSIALDMKILFYTIGVIVDGKGQ